MVTPAAPAQLDATNFDAIAGIYDDVFPPHIVEHYLCRRATYILRYTPAENALDVGAGTGVLAERLTNAGIAVTALDPFPGMLTQLRQRRPDIPTIVANGEELPFPDNEFDLTYSVAVMHHIARPELVQRTVSEMVRVTRRGGHILIWDHNPLNPYWSLLMRRVPQDVGSERLVPMEEILDDLHAAGATVLRADRRGLMPEFVPPSLLGVAAAVERLVEAIPGIRAFCSHDVVLARKV
jgi:ubiquinone/menaquinone biosynthesis C-methylase UbiE